MKGVEFINEVQKKLAIPDFVIGSAKVTYENAVSKKLDTKHNLYALACSTIYLFAKRTGVNITLNQLCEFAPVTREEVINAYEDVRKIV